MKPFCLLLNKLVLNVNLVQVKKKREKAWRAFRARRHFVMEPKNLILILALTLT